MINKKNETVEVTESEMQSVKRFFNGIYDSVKRLEKYDKTESDKRVTKVILGLLKLTILAIEFDIKHENHTSN